MIYFFQIIIRFLLLTFLLNLLIFTFLISFNLFVLFDHFKNHFFDASVDEWDMFAEDWGVVEDA